MSAALKEVSPALYMGVGEIERLACEVLDLRAEVKRLGTQHLRDCDEVAALRTERDELAEENTSLKQENHTANEAVVELRAMVERIHAPEAT